MDKKWSAYANVAIPNDGDKILYENAGATNSLYQTYGQLKADLINKLGGVSYQGTWNATTNIPAIVSSTGTQGFYYVVSADGSTNIDGITDWKISDWIIFNGTSWEKVDNTDSQKADKVIGAVNNNFAGLDTNGNLQDSGSKSSDFEPTDNTILKQANIVDNLTSTSTIEPLSANQGKTLNDNYQTADTNILNTRKGESWYVANNGNDTTGVGSILNPYLTIQKGIDIGSSGDVINLQGGAYTEDVNFATGQSRCISGNGTDNATLLNGNITFDSTGSIYTLINNIDIRGKFTTTGLGGIRFKDCKLLNSTGNSIEISGNLTSNIVFDRTQISQGNIVISSSSFTNDIQIKNTWLPVDITINGGIVQLENISEVGNIILNAGILIIRDVALLKRITINATSATGSAVFFFGNNSFLQVNQTFEYIVRSDISKNAPIYVAGILTDNPTAHTLFTSPILPLNHLNYFTTGYTPSNYTALADIIYYHLSGINTALGTKQDSIGFTPEDVANKLSSFQVTPDDTHYASEKLVKDSLDNKLDVNVAITGATKTKITYDINGLITSGDDATTNDIVDYTDKRYVTDAEKTILSNTSNTNTGDQDILAEVVTGFISTTGTITNTDTIETSIEKLDGNVANKVDKVTGKDLSTNDFTDTLKTNYDLAYTQSLKHNQLSTAPTVTDDGTSGYSVGSQWLETTTNTLYECKDITTGSAVWVALGGGGSSSFLDSTFNISNSLNNTKKIKLDASGITTGTTRTYTMPNMDGTIATLAQAVTSGVTTSAPSQNAVYSHVTSRISNFVEKVTNVITTTNVIYNLAFGHNSMNIISCSASGFPGVSNYFSMSYNGGLIYLTKSNGTYQQMDNLTWYTIAYGVQVRFNGSTAQIKNTDSRYTITTFSMYSS